ncbi:MAG: efflux RND transporter periplasmic adaptor subunit [Phycisphaerae bacterium]|nr:efflux RND transporter periplasmic adaptor subunit [Phycisphaerae bacterium]
MKILLSILAVVILLGGAIGGIAMQFRHRSAQGTLVRVEKVERGDLVEIVSAPGIIQPKSNVKISARVSARILEIPCREGTRVTKGNPSADPPIPPSVLIRLDSKDLEAQLRAAEARKAAQEAQIQVATSAIAAQEAFVASRQAELENAQRILARQEKLFESRDISEAAVEEAQSRVDQLRAQLLQARLSLQAERDRLTVLRHEVAAAEADIARNREALSYTTITSPIDGVVTKVNSEVGELVVVGTMNNQGTVIMEVADLDRMIVNTRVDEGTVAAVKIGQKAKVRSQAYKDEVFEGEVTAVALAQTEEQRENLRYYKTEVTLNTSGRQIVSGLTADVDIETQRHENVLKVPSQAVLGRSVDELPLAVRDRPEVDKSRALVTVVYRFVDGKAQVTPVRIGASDVTHTVIESGLSEGDLIVTGPFKVLDSLRHDQPIRDEATTTTQPTGGAGK